MGNQSADNNSRVSVTQIYTNLFATRRSKALLFIGTLIIALVISAYIGELEIVDIFSSYGVLSLLLFPAGIFIWLSQLPGGGVDDSAAPFLIISALIFWVVYLVLIINGIRRENIKTSRILFLVHVLLLLLNIGGCAVHNT